jgi:hypothetical protein
MPANPKRENRPKFNELFLRTHQTCRTFKIARTAKRGGNGMLDLRKTFAFWAVSALLLACFALAVPLFQSADVSEGDVVDSISELIRDYLMFRETAWPLVPPRMEYMSRALDENDWSVLREEDWHVRLFESIRYTRRNLLGRTTKTPTVTDLVLYENLEAEEIIVLIQDEESETYRELLAVNAPPFPKLTGANDRRILEMELTKRRIVWPVKLIPLELREEFLRARIPETKDEPSAKPWECAADRAMSCGWRSIAWKATG